MTDTPNLSDSLEEAIRHPSLQDSATALAELALDSTLDLGVLRDVPLVGICVSLARTSVAIRDRLFLNKLVHFLKELDVVPADQRTIMIQKVNESDSFRLSVGEKLLYILDRCEDHRTSQIVAIFFTAFLQERISYDDFLRLAHAADSSMLSDVLDFADGDWNSLPAEEATHLLGSGLIEIVPFYIQVEDQDDWKMNEKYKVEGGELEVRVTELGKTLRKLLGKTGHKDAEQ